MPARISSFDIFSKYEGYLLRNSSMAAIRSCIERLLSCVALYNKSSSVLSLILSETPLRLAFAKLVSALAISLIDFFALNKLATQSIISELYADNNVIPITSADCQENKLPRSCFHTGTAVCPSDFIRLNSSLALFNSSTNIGKLLDMARKN